MLKKIKKKKERKSPKSEFRESLAKRNNLAVEIGAGKACGENDKFT